MKSQLYHLVLMFPCAYLVAISLKTYFKKVDVTSNNARSQKYSLLIKLVIY